MSAPGAADDVLLRLPDEHRHAFKEPLGEVYTDAERLLLAHSPPFIAVGDVVTATLLEAGHPPAVALVDGKTEREAVDPGLRRRTRTLEREIEVANPAGTITRSLVSAIVTALDDGDPVRIEVTGEEDLAVIPAMLAAPIGATIIYGQPGEGMVAVAVTEESVDHAGSLLSYFDGDQDSLLELIAGR